MQPDLPANPYARPLGPRWYAALAALVLLLALVVTAALTVEQWLPDRRDVKEGLAAFIAPYQVLFDASLPGEESAEYVVFLREGTPPEQVARFVSEAGLVPVERAGIFADTVVVKLGASGRDGLEQLRAQPFVKLTIRNQGVFFCH